MTDIYVLFGVESICHEVIQDSVHFRILCNHPAYLRECEDSILLLFSDTDYPNDPEDLIRTLQETVSRSFFLYVFSHHPANIFEYGGATIVEPGLLERQNGREAKLSWTMVDVIENRADSEEVVHILRQKRGAGKFYGQP